VAYSNSNQAPVPENMDTADNYRGVQAANLQPGIVLPRGIHVFMSIITSEQNRNLIILEQL